MDLLKNPGPWLFNSIISLSDLQFRLAALPSPAPLQIQDVLANPPTFCLSDMKHSLLACLTPACAQRYSKAALIDMRGGLILPLQFSISSPAPPPGVDQFKFRPEFLLWLHAFEFLGAAGNETFGEPKVLIEEPISQLAIKQFLGVDNTERLLAKQSYADAIKQGSASADAVFLTTQLRIPNEQRTAVKSQAEWKSPIEPIPNPSQIQQFGGSQLNDSAPADGHMGTQFSQSAGAYFDDYPAFSERQEFLPSQHQHMRINPILESPQRVAALSQAQQFYDENEMPANSQRLFQTQLDFEIESEGNSLNSQSEPKTPIRSNKPPSQNNSTPIPIPGSIPPNSPTRDFHYSQFPRVPHHSPILPMPIVESSPPVQSKNSESNYSKSKRSRRPREVNFLTQPQMTEVQSDDEEDDDEDEADDDQELAESDSQTASHVLEQRNSSESVLIEQQNSIRNHLNSNQLPQPLPMLTDDPVALADFSAAAIRDRRLARQEKFIQSDESQNQIETQHVTMMMTDNEADADAEALFDSMPNLSPESNRKQRDHSTQQILSASQNQRNHSQTADTGNGSVSLSLSISAVSASDSSNSIHFNPPRSRRAEYNPVPSLHRAWKYFTQPESNK